MPVPFTFATATTSIPLSQLDNNFSTVTTLGNTSVVLGNTVTSVGNLTVTNGTYTNYTESVVNIGTVTTANTLSLTNGTVQIVTLTAANTCTFTMPTATDGKSFVLIVTGAATANATFTGVKFAGNTAPTITTTGNKDILSFIAYGSAWYGNYSQNYP
jgi:hypothetical protein